jgi:hypothetical protein
MTDAVEAGKELAQGAEVDTTTDTDTDMNATDDDVTAPAQAIENYGKMRVRSTGFNTFLVLRFTSEGDLKNRVHEVDLNGDQPSCTCGDHEYRRGDTPEVCKHVAIALENGASRQADLGELAMHEFVRMMAGVEEQLDRLESARDVTRAQADAKDVADSQGGETTAADPDVGVTAEEAADTLQSAYDGVVEDMQVRAHNDYVWVQTGQDTPQNLDAPGNPAVFDLLLKNADQVTYVHDDHELASEKPGEWWKNAIKPDAVDAYIEEVL